MQNLCEHEKEQTLISLTVWWILSGPVRPLPRALSPEEAVIRLPVSPQVYLERPRSVRPPEHSLTFFSYFMMKTKDSKWLIVDYNSHEYFRSATDWQKSSQVDSI